MGGSSNKGLLRLIPPVDELLADPAVTALRGVYPDFPWTALIREVVLTYREAGVGKEDRDSVRAELTASVGRRFESLRQEASPLPNPDQLVLHAGPAKGGGKQDPCCPCSEHGCQQVCSYRAARDRCGFQY